MSFEKALIIFMEYLRTEGADVAFAVTMSKVIDDVSNDLTRFNEISVELNEYYKELVRGRELA